MEMNNLLEFRESVRPLPGHGAEEYELRITNQIEFRGGVAWTADLLRNGVRVGAVEDRGDGGAVVVDFYTPEERKQWNLVVSAAYPESSEEDFVSHLDFLSLEKDS